MENMAFVLVPLAVVVFFLVKYVPGLRKIIEGWQGSAKELFARMFRSK